MARQVCIGCKSRFFEDENSLFEGNYYCSYCRLKARLCGVCGLIKVMKHETVNDVWLCEDCKDRTSTFPNLWLMLRFRCFQRDKFHCVYCGRSPLLDLTVMLHCDHVKPKSKGGEDILENLVTSCSECNMGKMDVMLDNYTRRLISRRLNGINQEVKK